MSLNKFTRWHRLDQLRRHLMYVGYNELDLKHLEALRGEVAAKETEARTSAFNKAEPAGEEGS